MIPRLLSAVLISVVAFEVATAGDSVNPDLSFLADDAAHPLKVAEITDVSNVALSDANVVLLGGHLVRVSLYGRSGIPGSKLFPDGPEQYKDIRMLIFVDCNIAQELPAYFGGLQSLTHFEASGNAISANIEMHRSPPMLKVFRVSNTSLTGSVDRFLVSAANLEVFDIINTRMVLTPSIVLRAMPKLRRASFSTGSISGTDGKWEQVIGPDYEVSKWKGAGPSGDAVVVTRKSNDVLIEGRPKQEVMDELLKPLQGENVQNPDSSPPPSPPSK